MAVAQPLQSESPVRPRVARWAVATIFFINGALLANWFARIPDVKQQLGLTEGALGFALLATAVGALIAQTTTGGLIARFGSRAVTSYMGILFCLAFGSLGFAFNLPLLVILLGVMGAFNGGLDVAMNSQAALVERAYGQPIMSSFHGMWSVGGLVGAGVGALAVSNNVPLTTHFIVATVVGLIVIAVALRGLIPDTAAEGGHGALFALPPRALLPMGIVAFCALVCEGAIGDWSAIYLREDVQSDEALAATGYAVFALMMAGGRFTGDWLAARLGSGLLVRLGGVLMSIGMILALISNTPWMAIAGFALVGAGVSCIFPLIMSAASNTPGVEPGRGIAAMATVGYSGFLIGPPLIGTLAEVVQLRGALGLLALFSVAIVLFGSAVRAKPVAS